MFSLQKLFNKHFTHNGTLTSNTWLEAKNALAFRLLFSLYDTIAVSTSTGFEANVEDCIRRLHLLLRLHIFSGLYNDLPQLKWLCRLQCFLQHKKTPRDKYLDTFFSLFWAKSYTHHLRFNRAYHLWRNNLWHLCQSHNRRIRPLRYTSRDLTNKAHGKLNTTTKGAILFTWSLRRQSAACYNCTEAILILNGMGVTFVQVKQNATK